MALYEITTDCRIANKDYKKWDIVSHEEVWEYFPSVMNPIDTIPAKKEPKEAPKTKEQKEEEVVEETAEAPFEEPVEEKKEVKEAPKKASKKK